ncbi:MAG: ParB/RepB/Spo0J family partition protein [Rhodoferax sp.]|nr:ParB/RepB/Spo0J family partition protein [Rhodoferax sp.]MDP3650911.1 ParB/RepB/Spo0J family partition protein [Rhodoferax sp.]
MTEYSLDSGHALAGADPVQTIEVTQVLDADEFANLLLTSIATSLTNPRTIFDQSKLGELASSIKASGVHQPVLVRPLPASRLADTFDLHRARFGGRNIERPTHELVCGERRYRACLIAGVKRIPALIRELTDHQVLEIQIVENLQRDDLSELEEAVGFDQLMTLSGINADEVGIKIDKSRSYVYSRLKLLDLTSEVKTSLRTGVIDASRALLLARIPDTALQIKALGEITHKGYDGDMSMGYRAAAAHVQRNYMLKLDSARFKITDATLVPDAGSCKTCTKRTGHEPDLFEDVKGADVCTDPPCFRRKEEAHTAQLLKAAHEHGQLVIDGREAKALMPNSWSGIEGYLRLDDAQDSPTDKSLRKLLGKQLDQDEVQTTLIANPHKAGELIAVLPTAKVAELLKAKGHQDAAERIDMRLESSQKAEAAAAKQEAKATYEQSWRNSVMTRTWAAINNEGTFDVSSDVYRHLAMHYACACNTDRAKQVGKVLELGKVAPKDGLLDYVKNCEYPARVLQLLVMHADVEYRHWLSDDDSNKGLLLIAADYGVDIGAIKADTKGQMRAKKPVAPIAPAALANANAGGPGAGESQGPGGKGPSAKT